MAARRSSGNGPRRATYRFPSTHRETWDQRNALQTFSECTHKHCPNAIVAEAPQGSHKAFGLMLKPQRCKSKRGDRAFELTAMKLP